jgi:hypothetical protein
MSIAEVSVEALRIAFDAAVAAPEDQENDYRIFASFGPVYVSRSRAGTVSLLIALDSCSPQSSRSGGGFTLISAEIVTFEHAGTRWQQPAAVLDCTDTSLLGTFAVLCADISRLLLLDESARTWKALVAWVEAWQFLLGRKPQMSAQKELGLWGELWLIKQAADPNLLLESWRGPERAPLDLFVNGTGLEVKSSRSRNTHFVSQSQVETPAGQFDCYLVSIWAGIDPLRGVSLPDVVDALLLEAADGPRFLRQIAIAGYSPVDRKLYQTKYFLLDRPTLYAIDAVPRVRLMDEGVSNLRYQISLDATDPIDASIESEVWTRTLGRAPTIERLAEGAQ